MSFEAKLRQNRLIALAVRRELATRHRNDDQPVFRTRRIADAATLAPQTPDYGA